MLFNKMKNYKIFAKTAKLQQSWLVFLALFTLLLASVNVRAEEQNTAQATESNLQGISYNTIQDDQIELVFDFTANT